MTTTATGEVCPRRSTADLVREFHAALDVTEYPPDTPTEDIDPASARRQAACIAEAAAEALRALGFHRAAAEVGAAEQVVETERPQEIPDLVSTAHSLARLDYAAVDAALALGIPHDAVVEEVHRSNLTLARKGQKIVRPPSWRSPAVHFAMVAADSQEVDA